MGMDIPFHYRNKAQFPVSCDKNGGVRIGFYAERSHNIIDTDNCVIQSDISNDIVKKYVRGLQSIIFIRITSWSIQAMYAI